jgi:hypothetical protein
MNFGTSNFGGEVRIGNKSPNRLHGRFLTDRLPDPISRGSPHDGRFIKQVFDELVVSYGFDAISGSGMQVKNAPQFVMKAVPNQSKICFSPIRMGTQRVLAWFIVHGQN